MDGQETASMHGTAEWIAPVVALPAGRAANEFWRAWARAATRWRLAQARLAEWRLRAEHRRQLDRFDERMLKDIGLSRAGADRETRKWFWQA